MNGVRGAHVKPSSLKSRMCCLYITHNMQHSLNVFYQICKIPALTHRQSTHNHHECHTVITIKYTKDLCYVSLTLPLAEMSIMGFTVQTTGTGSRLVSSLVTAKSKTKFQSTLLNINTESEPFQAEFESSWKLT